MEVTIKTNAIDAKHFYNYAARQQIPFAMSKAVNSLAYDIRDKEQGQIGNFFDLRTNWLLKRGAMPVVTSRKSQLPNIHAILGVKDEVAALAAIGGQKSARAGDMAVPFTDAGGGSSTREILNPGTRTLGRSKWPSRIVRKTKGRKRKGSGGDPKPFILKGKSGRTFVAKRVDGASRPLEILYELKPKVNVPLSWPLVDNATVKVAMDYDAYLARALDAAIKAPRRRG